MSMYDIVTEKQRQETLNYSRTTEFEGLFIDMEYLLLQIKIQILFRVSFLSATTDIPFQMIETISPRPLLFIIGENAHSRYFSEDAYKLASEPKELYIVPEAGHVDLYDKTELIPFDKLELFFKQHLK